MTPVLDLAQRRGMIWFSSRQRLIILDFANDAVAREWDALSDADIVRRLRVPSSSDYSEYRNDALAVRDAHDPAKQIDNDYSLDNSYTRCALCRTSHPCDAYDMADTVLRIIDQPERKNTCSAPTDST